jgi:universal stress protein A
MELRKGETQFLSAPLAEIHLKKILVPIDFSESCRRALRYGETFARQFNSEITLLHVIEPMPPLPDPVAVASVSIVRLHKEAERQLAGWRRKIAVTIPVKSRIGAGTPYREIVSAADDSNIDLIILGTHGRTGLAHFLMGSTAERVVRHAPCPVMVVREREHDFVEEAETGVGTTKRKETRYGKRIKKE